VNPAVVQAVLARSRGRCEWCGYRHELELHHVVHKGMGGRRRTKETSDHPDNLVRLCKVCHGAAHSETVALASGHRCASCYRRTACAYAR